MTGPPRLAFVLYETQSSLVAMIRGLSNRVIWPRGGGGYSLIWAI